MAKWSGREKEYFHEYYVAHKAELRAKNKEYIKVHKEELREKQKEYCKKNAERIKEKKKEWEDRNREHVRKSRRDYMKQRYAEDPEFRNRAKARRKQEYKKFSSEERARRVVSRAIRLGKLARRPCEACGKEPTQAHHDDYNYPLKVRWLCSVCHAEWHRNNQPIRKEEDD